MFICNIETPYLDWYVKLLIVFCAYFDPLTWVKEEISNDRVLTAVFICNLSQTWNHHTRNWLQGL